MTSVHRPHAPARGGTHARPPAGALGERRVVAWLRRVAPPVAHRFAPVLAILLLLFSMHGDWRVAVAAPPTVAASARGGASRSPPIDGQGAPREPRGRRGAPTAADRGARQAMATGTTPHADTTQHSGTTPPASRGVSMAVFPAGAGNATGGPAPCVSSPARRAKATSRPLTGTLNLNPATEEQLMMLPTVGPAKAARIVAWRARNGGFRRAADLRRVKGFGYATFRRLEALLAVTGETTLR